MTDTPTTTTDLNRELELRLFGDDLTARTDEQIASAVQSGLRRSDGPDGCVYEWAGNGFYLKWPTERVYDVGASGNNGYGIWFWNHRHDEPWQSSIEQHVRDYRRKPRNFTTPDGMMLVIEEMKKRGWLMHLLTMCDGFVANAKQYRLPDDGDWNKSFCMNGVALECDDSATLAVAKAARAALRSEEK